MEAPIRGFHNRAHTPEWTAWQAMKSRCTNPKYMHFKHYGGRGITICDQWFSSFQQFFSDVGPKPTPKHTLDRINVDGNYEPSNVKWATRKEQTTNRRKVGELQDQIKVLTARVAELEAQLAAKA